MKHSIIYISTTSSYLEQIVEKKRLRIFAGDFILNHASEEVQIFYKVLDDETLRELSNLPLIINDDSNILRILKIKKAIYDYKNSIIEITFNESLTEHPKRNDVLEIDKIKEFKRGESNIIVQIITAELSDFIWQLIDSYDKDNFEKTQQQFIDKITKNNQRDYSSVETLSSFFDKLAILLKSNQYPEFKERFFRGHSSIRYRLEPSNYRFHSGKRIYLDNEDKLFRELIINEPRYFQNDKNALEILTRMQHFGLPTRLLDVTLNPLTALYFACSSKDNEDGEVIIILPNQNNIKYYDSDTVSCLTNLAKMNMHDKNDIENYLLMKPTPKKLNYRKTSHKKFLHFIKEDKPYFQNLINTSDLTRIVCIKSKLNNERIAAQTGAFLLFGIKSRMNEKSDYNYKIHRIRINKDSKSDILKELDLVNINSKTIYPTLENTAKYLLEKYK